MAKSVVGLFDTQAEAQAVVQDLVARGFSRDSISIVANKDAQTGLATPATDTAQEHGEAGDDVVAGASVGAATGGLVGGGIGLILGLIGASAVPVIGPIIAAGPIVAMIAGAGVGAVTGGIIGALTTAGVPEEDARIFEAGVNEGGTLVIVNSPDDWADAAYDTMEEHGAVNIDERASSYKPAQPGDMPIPIQAAADNTTRAVPLVEENLPGGQRHRSKGGVRVYPQMSERPVQAQDFADDTNRSTQP